MGLYNRNQDILNEILDYISNEDFTYDPEYDWTYPPQMWATVLAEDDVWNSEEEVNFVPIHPLPQEDLSEWDDTQLPDVNSGWNQTVIPPEGPSGWEIPPNELPHDIHSGWDQPVPQTPPPRTPPSSPPPAPKKKRL